MKATHSYVGRKRCGCVVTAVVDDPMDRRFTASCVAEMIREGKTIERVEHGQIKLDRCRCDEQPATENLL